MHIFDCGFVEIFDELESAIDELQKKSFAESKDIDFLKQFVKSPATTKLCEVSVTINSSKMEGNFSEVIGTYTIFSH